MSHHRAQGVNWNTGNYLSGNTVLSECLGSSLSDEERMKGEGDIGGDRASGRQRLAVRIVVEMVWTRVERRIKPVYMT